MSTDPLMSEAYKLPGETSGRYVHEESNWSESDSILLIQAHAHLELIKNCTSTSK